MSGLTSIVTSMMLLRTLRTHRWDPEELERLLAHLKEWRVLESRAILEIIKGRLGITEKFHSMIVNNAAEIAGSKGDDNMHDLLAGHPWLLNPEWQILAEEKSISKQLREWNAEDIRQRESFQTALRFPGADGGPENGNYRNKAISAPQ